MIFNEADLGAIRKITGCQEAHQIATSPLSGKWVNVVAQVLTYMLFRTIQSEVERRQNDR